MTDHSTEHPTPSVYVRRTVQIGQEKVEVTRLAPVPSSRRVTVDDEADCADALDEAARQGLLPDEPPKGMGRAIARATTDEPALRCTRMRSGIVIDYTDLSDVATLRTSLSPMTALPGHQPRGGSAGGRTGQVRDPTDGVDPQATPLGLPVMVFADAEHLRAWCADALTRSLTRARKRRRAEEIAATGVRRPVAASMVLLKFADGTGSQWVPMLGDGITRFAVCAAAVTGQLDVDPSIAGTAIAQRLLAPLTALDESSPSHMLARGMRATHQTHVDEYNRHVDDDGPDEIAVRLRQFLTLPTDLHLMASDPKDGQPRAMEPALEAVVSDLHTGVDGWAAEDDARYTAMRSLKLLAGGSTIGADLFDLCAGRIDLSQCRLLHGPPDDPGPSLLGSPQAQERVRAGSDRLLLRRAVTIMAALLNPGVYPAFKHALRTTSGRKQLQLHHVVEFIAPLVCEPWGTQKPITRAWAYGGPVPAWAREVSFTPTHPLDYLDLARAAEDLAAPEAATQAARLELALAGGTALIADGILTTALVGGSGSTSTPLPFRGPINAAIDALTGSTEGLTALAVAANHFQPSRNVRTARLPAVDITRADRVARDGMGIPIRTTETVLAGLAARAASPTANDATPEDELQDEPDPLQTLQQRARHLPAEARTMLRGVELTKSLHDDTGGPSGLTEHDLDTILDSLSRSLRLAGRLT